MCYYSTQHSSSAGMNSTKNSNRGCVCYERQLRRHFQLLNWRGKKRAGAFLRRVREYFSRSSRGRDRIDSSHRHSVCPERDKVLFLLQSTSALHEPFLILGETSSWYLGFRVVIYFFCSRVCLSQRSLCVDRDNQSMFFPPCSSSPSLFVTREW